jgi:hypothetical protein
MIPRELRGLCRRQYPRDPRAVLSIKRVAAGEAAAIPVQSRFLNPVRLMLVTNLSPLPPTVGRAIVDKFPAWLGGMLPVSSVFPTQLGGVCTNPSNVQQQLTEQVHAETRGALFTMTPSTSSCDGKALTSQGEVSPNAQDALASRPRMFANALRQSDVRTAQKATSEACVNHWLRHFSHG